jgi:hypothetical protein
MLPAKLSLASRLPIAPLQAWAPPLDSSVQPQQA